jgi:hypothetical protein
MHRLSSGTRVFAWDVLGSRTGPGRDGCGVPLCRWISDAFDARGRGSGLTSCRHRESAAGSQMTKRRGWHLRPISLTRYHWRTNVGWGCTHNSLKVGYSYLQRCLFFFEYYLTIGFCKAVTTASKNDKKDTSLFKAEAGCPAHISIDSCSPRNSAS